MSDSNNKLEDIADVFNKAEKVLTAMTTIITVVISVKNIIKGDK